MSTATTFDVLISALPAVLIVSVSIPLDYSLRHEEVSDRCKIQILIWLALAVSIRMLPGSREEVVTTDEDQTSDSVALQSFIFSWGYVTIFFSLLNILVDCLNSRSRIAGRSKTALQDLVQLFPICSWLSMIVAIGCTVVTTTKTSTPVYFVVAISLRTFLGSFAVLCFLRWYANRKSKVSIELQGMPTATRTTIDSNGSILARFCGGVPTPLDTVASPDCWLDERRWYTWTRKETIQWFAQQLSSPLSQGGNHCDDISDLQENDRIIQNLLSHSITGDVLEDLIGVPQLVALQIPFGPACRLADSISELVDRYPKQQQSSNTRGRRRKHNDYKNNSGSGGYLGLHDEQYNRTSERSTRPQQSRMGDVPFANGNEHNNTPSVHGNEHPPPYHHDDPIAQGGITEEHQEKMNNVMKERFGLELPKLRATDYLAVHKGWAADTGNVESSHEPCQGASQASSSSIDNGTKNHTSASPGMASIPQNILEGMPPELKEIAKRRPDLLETIWKKREQVVHPLQQSRSTASTTLPNATTGRSSIPLGTQLDTGVEGSTIMQRDCDDHDNDDYECDDEDEMTSLIHKETNEFPLRYRSIDKAKSEGFV